MKFKVFNAFLKERLALLCIYLINSFKIHIAKSFSNKRKNKKNCIPSSRNFWESKQWRSKKWTPYMYIYIYIYIYSLTNKKSWYKIKTFTQIVWRHPLAMMKHENVYIIYLMWKTKMFFQLHKRVMTVLKKHWHLH